MRIEGIEQGSPEWLVAHRGKFTTSHTGDIMIRNSRGEYYAAYKNIFREKRKEICSPQTAEHWFPPSVKRAVEWGIATQWQANSCYEVVKGVFTQPGGWWIHDYIPRFGSSPDYLVGRDGLLEIKCPETDTHLDYVAEKQIPEQYFWQMMGQMCVTGREWCDFMTFDPRVDPAVADQFWIERVYRDEKLIRAIELEVTHFLEKLDQHIRTLKSNGVSHVSSNVHQLQRQPSCP